MNIGVVLPVALGSRSFLDRGLNLTQQQDFALEASSIS